MSKDVKGNEGWIGRLIWFCLDQKLVVALMMLFVIGWGVVVAPVDWDIRWLPRDPVAVDAIPDIGENQQIVFTRWTGRSPQDVEDQITYPLTVALLGVPEVKTVRSNSAFGFSTIYVIFKDHVDFYWSRTRLLEKLSSLPAGTLPPRVQPTLGPDATALGQVFWYTLEGRNPDGKPEGGWDLDELRSTQDWYVRYGLLAADGVSEVATVGGFVREYQIDVDPDAMRAHGVTLEQVFNAVRMSNIDVGARTIEVNRVEYLVRGLGFIDSLSDIEHAVVKVTDNVPLTIKEVANVTLGPAIRRGALDKSGAEAVGGVVVARYGENPLTTISNVKKKIEELTPGLPTKTVIDWSSVNPTRVRRFAHDQGFDAFLDDGLILDQEAWLSWLRSAARPDWPPWVTTSQVTIVPFYDRTELIHETLGTLNEALVEEALVTVMVVIVMLVHLRSSLLISLLLPIAVLMTFIAMKVFRVDANIVALSGIAIAIGTMVDMGVVLCENILKRLDDASPQENRLEVIYRASVEVGSAVLTAVATTVVSFLPVFTMIGAEGKLFKPLAFTKTFALIASVILALTMIPPAAYLLMGGRVYPSRIKQMCLLALVVIGGLAAWYINPWLGLTLICVGAYYLVSHRGTPRVRQMIQWGVHAVVWVVVAVILTRRWLPLGPELGFAANLIFVVILIGGVLVVFRLFEQIYGRLLRWCLDHQLLALTLPGVLVIAGGCAWIGFDRVFFFVPAAASRMGIDPDRVRANPAWVGASGAFPGLGKEFMPALDEGSFLYMPTTMPHASIGEALDVIQKLDVAMTQIPEVEMVVGKLGRAETPLDPAPISMIETIIRYKSQYITDKNGHRLNYRFDESTNHFARDEYGMLIPDSRGRPFRQWREHIRSPDDIWREIEAAGQLPGTTGAPKLQPIAARIVMLQSGMRAPMGVKIKGPDLQTIERVGLDIERLLKQIPSVEPTTVIADRIVGKPYLEIDIDRLAIARYGLKISQVQEVIEVAIGGKTLTQTVEGRQRYPVRVRYQRELRDSIETLGHVLVAAPDGTQVPLSHVSKIVYSRGPQVIKSEGTFLVGYVLFDMKPGHAEVDVVEQARRHLKQKQRGGHFHLPAGVSYTFAGNYENQIRSQETLAVVLPVALLAIFLILYLQFRSALTTGLVFTGIVIAWAGGFLMIWLYGQPWFMDFTVLGVDMRQLFQIQPINLSVAIWVGFLALFGIASDNGVIIATYLNQRFSRDRPSTVHDIRHAAALAGVQRIRPALITTATTLLALIPVLTSTGRGSDIMVPMAIPSFGGMLIVLATIYVVPVLYSMIEECKLKLPALPAPAIESHHSQS